MKKLFTIIALCCMTLHATAQTDAELICDTVPAWVKELLTEEQYKVVKEYADLYAEVDFSGFKDCEGDPKLIEEVVTTLRTEWIPGAKDAPDFALKAQADTPRAVHWIAPLERTTEGRRTYEVFRDEESGMCLWLDVEYEMKDGVPDAIRYTTRTNGESYKDMFNIPLRFKPEENCFPIILSGAINYHDNGELKFVKLFRRLNMKL